MRRGVSLRLALFAAVAVPLGLLGTLALAQWFGDLDAPTAGNTPGEMFEGLIEKPIPADVRHIEGVGDLWQSYNIWLRFHASDRFIESLIAKDYTPVPWTQVERSMRLPQHRGYHRFDPPWDPEGIADKECFEGHVRCRWAQQHHGHHFLVIDRRTGTVYFFGMG